MGRGIPEPPRRSRKPRILVVSQHDPVQLLTLVLEAGGDGCLDKGCLGIDLLTTIKRLGGR
jgi:hypothetical protein